jgi:hypothetical protein
VSLCDRRWRGAEGGDADSFVLLKCWITNARVEANEGDRYMQHQKWNGKGTDVEEREGGGGGNAPKYGQLIRRRISIAERGGARGPGHRRRYVVSWASEIQRRIYKNEDMSINFKVR